MLICCEAPELKLIVMDVLCWGQAVVCRLIKLHFCKQFPSLTAKLVLSGNNYTSSKERSILSFSIQVVLRGGSDNRYLPNPGGGGQYLEHTCTERNK